MGEYAAYGPLALPLAVISVLVQVVWTLTKRRRENGHTEDFRADLKADIMSLRRSIHEIRDLLQSIVTKTALIEYRVTKLEERHEYKP